MCYRVGPARITGFREQIAERMVAFRQACVTVSERMSCNLIDPAIIASDCLEMTCGYAPR